MDFLNFLDLSVYDVRKSIHRVCFHARDYIVDSPEVEGGFDALNSFKSFYNIGFGSDFCVEEDISCWHFLRLLRCWLDFEVQFSLSHVGGTQKDMWILNFSI